MRLFIEQAHANGAFLLLILIPLEQGAAGKERMLRIFRTLTFNLTSATRPQIPARKVECKREKQEEILEIVLEFVISSNSHWIRLHEYVWDHLPLYGVLIPPECPVWRESPVPGAVYRIPLWFRPTHSGRDGSGCC